MLSLTRKYIESRHGRAGWERVLEALSPEDRDCVASAIALGWYPTSTFMNVFDALERTVGAGNPRFIVDFARDGAEQDLNVFHRVFLRMANPAFVAEKVGEYWSRFHTHGSWTYERVDHGYIGRLSGFESRPIYCEVLVPYMTRMLELVGAKQVRVTHPECVHKGQPDCVFVAKWT